MPGTARCDMLELAKPGGTHRQYVRDNSQVDTPAVPTPTPPNLDSRLIVAIESCDFRISECNCLGKPARCRLGGYPAIVDLEWCKGCSVTAPETAARATR
jgi:hypothetical protein